MAEQNTIVYFIKSNYNINRSSDEGPRIATIGPNLYTDVYIHRNGVFQNAEEIDERINKSALCTMVTVINDRFTCTMYWFSCQKH